VVDPPRLDYSEHFLLHFITSPPDAIPRNSYGLGLREWEEPRVKTADLLQYDLSVFYFDPEEEVEQKG
jgi:hypothetical protein